MVTTEQIQIIKSTLEPFVPVYIGIFGSFARGEQKANSDLDILVNFSKQLTLIDLIGLEQSLSEKLGLKVDLVTEKALSPLFRDDVLKEVKQIA